MARARTSSIPELLLSLEREGPVALHRQLERGLQEQIRLGRLEPGAPLPSTRALAAELGLSRGVVVEAYEQLAAEGYLESRPGGKTRVGHRSDGGAVDGRGAHGRAGTGNGRRLREREADDVAADAPGSIPNESETSARFDFGYGRPDVDQFPRQAWLRSLRRVLNEAPSERLSYIDARGAPELREALASYLHRVRGASATAGDIVITNGFAQGQRLAFQIIGTKAGQATRRSNVIRIAQEEPGQDDTRRAAESLGVELVPIPVDDDGLVVERLVGIDAALCVVTPAHHFPGGAVMSPERRAALVRWARERDSYILEDDYD